MKQFDYECPACHAHRTVKTIGEVMEVKCLSCNRPMCKIAHNSGEHVPAKVAKVEHTEDFEQMELFNLKQYELGG